MNIILLPLSALLLFSIHPPERQRNPSRGGKSLGVFRREIKFWEARRNDSPRARYGYCFNVFESNIDASWAREAARNETLAEQDETERPT